ncbi:hypothetical protein HZC20_01225 [Candidatus Peregrinibacteria bacterium]|nr:hypothetical protein [Candidatus Peregrinibacteria bacterium]
MKKFLIIAIALSLVLTACIKKRDEKKAYIDATVEATCLVLQSENIFDPKLEQPVRDIYKKYGFKSDDTDVMRTVTAKYGKDQEIKNQIKADLSKCPVDFGQKVKDSVQKVGEKPAEEMKPSDTATKVEPKTDNKAAPKVDTKPAKTK